MLAAARSLEALTAFDHLDFVRNAHQTILGRTPTASEEEGMLSALMRGDTKTWLLGGLRYGKEGRARRVSIPGLRWRFLAQRAFRVFGVGAVLSWTNAVARLPQALRHLRAVQQRNAANFSETHGLLAQALERIAEHHLVFEAIPADIRKLRGDLDELCARVSGVERLESAIAELRSILERLDGDRKALATALHSDVDELGARVSGVERLESAIAELRAVLERLDGERESLAAAIKDLRGGLARINPPVLAETLEISNSSLVELARQRSAIPPEVTLASLSPDARYALFETVFYESPAVAAKQRVYIPYIDRRLAGQFPFLDLGCGRGEFLRILRGEGIESVGVDINATVLRPLRADGFHVVESGILEYLAGDRTTYSGASILQVVEHLSSEDIERLLALVAPRLAPNAVLIVETPNPLSPFALGVFHTDPTHIAPLPPERMRYSIEAAGFERARILYQARIPAEQFAGPDPRAYYADYAVIAQRQSS